MKKDTHGVSICITPNWNFPPKDGAPSSSAVRGEPHTSQIITPLLRPGPSIFRDSIQSHVSDVEKETEELLVQQLRLYMHELQSQFPSRHQSTDGNPALTGTGTDGGRQRLGPPWSCGGFCKLQDSRLLEPLLLQRAGSPPCGTTGSQHGEQVFFLLGIASE